MAAAFRDESLRVESTRRLAALAQGPTARPEEKRQDVTGERDRARTEMLGAGVVAPFVASASTTKGNATQVYEQLAACIGRNKKLKAACRLIEYQKRIKVPDRRGEYRAFSADAPAAEGENLSAVIVDEVAAHRSPRLYRALEYATIGRPDGGFQVIISTAGDDLGHWYYARSSAVGGSSPARTSTRRPTPRSTKLDPTPARTSTTRRPGRNATPHSTSTPGSLPRRFGISGTRRRKRRGRPALLRALPVQYLSHRGRGRHGSRSSAGISAAARSRRSRSSGAAVLPRL